MDKAAVRKLTQICLESFRVHGEFDADLCARGIEHLRPVRACDDESHRWLVRRYQDFRPPVVTRNAGLTLAP